MGGLAPSGGDQSHKLKYISVQRIKRKVQSLPIRISQRSLHNAPIFRLLLKVAVNGTRSYDFLQFLKDP